MLFGQVFRDLYSLITYFNLRLISPGAVTCLWIAQGANLFIPYSDWWWRYPAIYCWSCWKHWARKYSCRENCVCCSGSADTCAIFASLGKSLLLEYDWLCLGWHMRTNKNMIAVLTDCERISKNVSLQL